MNFRVCINQIFLTWLGDSDLCSDEPCQNNSCISGLYLQDEWPSNKEIHWFLVEQIEISCSAGESNFAFSPFQIKHHPNQGHWSQLPLTKIIVNMSKESKI